MSILDSTFFNSQIHMNQHIKDMEVVLKSARKIHLEYDVISGNFLPLDITNGISHDAKYGQELIHMVEKRDLCIRDLGYFYLPDFHEINQKGAYYLSRLPINTQVYRKNGILYERLYLEDFIKKVSEGKTIEWFDVYIGKQHKVPTRLIIYKLTGSGYDRKNNVSTATKYKRQVSILMTNIPPDIL
ncbi:transposase [Bacillus thuringiensis]